MVTSSSLLLASLELSDTQVYEPSIRALLGTVSHFCEVVVVKCSIPRSGVVSDPLPSEEGTTYNILRTSPESQGQNLALTVLFVPGSLDSGREGPGRRKRAEETP